MKCPMKFGDPCADVDYSCDEDCAWLLWNNVNEACCAITALAMGSAESNVKLNANTERVVRK